MSKIITAREMTTLSGLYSKEVGSNFERIDKHLRVAASKGKTGIKTDVKLTINEIHELRLQGFNVESDNGKGYIIWAGATCEF